MKNHYLTIKLSDKRGNVMSLSSAGLKSRVEDAWRISASRAKAVGKGLVIHAQSKNIIAEFKINNVTNSKSMPGRKHLDISFISNSQYVGKIWPGTNRNPIQYV